MPGSWRTSAAPASPTAMRTQARAVMGSPSIARASSSAHTGIR